MRLLSSPLPTALLAAVLAALSEAAANPAFRLLSTRATIFESAVLPGSQTIISVWCDEFVGCEPASWDIRTAAQPTVLIDVDPSLRNETGMLQPVSSFPSNFAFNGTSRLFFAAETVGKGREPYLALLSGGFGATPLSARLHSLGDLEPGEGGSSPAEFTTLGPLVFFSANVTGYGRELFVFNSANGTLSGNTSAFPPTLVSDLWPGQSDSSPAFLTVYNGSLFFAATTPSEGTELFRVAVSANRLGNTSDILSWEVSLVADILTGSSGSSPSSLTVWPAFGRLVFQAQTLETGAELYSYDMAADVVELLCRVDPASNLSATASGLPAGSSPRAFTAAGSLLYFVAYTRANGTELWSLNGTRPSPRYDVNGTLLAERRAPLNATLVYDMMPGADGSDPDLLTVMANSLYWTATDAARGSEMRRMPLGGGAADIGVADVIPGPESSSPSVALLMRTGPFLLFTAGTPDFNVTTGGNASDPFDTNVTTITVDGPPALYILADPAATPLPTRTPSSTASSTATASQTATSSSTGSDTATSTPSGAPISATPTTSSTATSTSSMTATQSSNATSTATSSASNTAAPSASASISSSVFASPSNTATSSSTGTNTRSTSATPSKTRFSPSGSLTASFSRSRSFTGTRTATASVTETSSPSSSLTVVASPSSSLLPSATSSVTVVPSRSMTPTSTPTQLGSASPRVTQTQTRSPSVPASISPSPDGFLTDAALAALALEREAAAGDAGPNLALILGLTLGLGVPLCLVSLSCVFGWHVGRCAACAWREPSSGQQAKGARSNRSRGMHDDEGDVDDGVEEIDVGSGRAGEASTLLARPPKRQNDRFEGVSPLAAAAAQRAGARAAVAPASRGRTAGRAAQPYSSSPAAAPGKSQVSQAAPASSSAALDAALVLGSGANPAFERARLGRVSFQAQGTASGASASPSTQAQAQARRPSAAFDGASASLHHGRASISSAALQSPGASGGAGAGHFAEGDSQATRSASRRSTAAAFDTFRAAAIASAGPAGKGRRGGAAASADPSTGSAHSSGSPTRRT